MGNLRAKADRERKADRDAEKKRQRERAEKAKKRHEERAGPAAEFLTEWAGEHVSPELLEDISGKSGPSRYRTQLDGFHLVVNVTGQGEARAFTVVQLETGDTRDESREVERPADLLADWPVAA